MRPAGGVSCLSARNQGLRAPSEVSLRETGADIRGRPVREYQSAPPLFVGFFEPRMEDLEKKVSAMRGKFHSVSEDLKKVNRRIDTLKEHIKQSENYKEHRTVKRQYEKLYSEYTAARKETGFFAERKAQKALDAANDFYEANRAGLTLFDAADKYLRGVLQGRFDPKKLPPITKWREELTAKTAEKEKLYREYSILKEETAKVEKIKRSVAEILHSDEPMRTPARTRPQTQGIDL